jgi:hypothetical protein
MRNTILFLFYAAHGGIQTRPSENVQQCSTAQPIDGAKCRAGESEMSLTLLLNSITVNKYCKFYIDRTHLCFNEIKLQKLLLHI